MAVREYAEIFSDLIYCRECYICKANGILCRNPDRPEMNIEPWKNYVHIYHRFACQYKHNCKCNGCSLNKEGKCVSHTPESFRIFDQEIVQFLQTTTGEVEIYE